MEDLNINMVAILVAVVANFILGFVWYTPLFGKAWAKEMGFDMSVKPTGGQMAKGMIIMVIGNFLMAYVFAHNNAAERSGWRQGRSPTASHPSRASSVDRRYVVT
jgi:hypothetical protein